MGASSPVHAWAVGSGLDGQAFQVDVVVALEDLLAGLARDVEVPHAGRSKTFEHELSSCQDSKRIRPASKPGDEQFRQEGRVWAGALKELAYTR
jgi:hypothetical protein